MPKKIFISYSHEDEPFVQGLVDQLNAQGVPLFFDKWDIAPGDSLVRKIFEEGLRDAELFVIVLSRASVESKWVREELDAATVRKIEGLTKVIPILKDDCEVPISLRALLWLDMRRNPEESMRRLVNIAHGLTEKPVLGMPPERVQKADESISGLSKMASTVAVYMVMNSDMDSGHPQMWQGADICSALGLAPDEVNDAVDELKTTGLATTIDYIGTAPFQFGQVGPTYALFSESKHILPYDPEEDIRVVSAAVAALNEVDALSLAEYSKLSPGRMNRAVQYIDDYGIADVMKFLGTAPYSFGRLRATRRTRQFIQSH